MLFAARRTALVDQLHRTSDERLRKLGRIGDRRGAADELRVGAVEPAQAKKPADDVGQVGAEHAAIGVNLVDNDVAQVLKQLDPLGVVRQDARMQHIRIGDDDVTGLADLPSGRRGRVAVVGVGLHVHAHRLDELVELRDLIGGQRLRREEVQRARIRLMQNGVEHREVVAHGLAGGRRRDDTDVPVLRCQIKRLALMAVEPVHAALLQHGRNAAVHLRREILIDRLTRRDRLPMRDVFHEGRRVLQPVQELFKVHVCFLPMNAAREWRSDPARRRKSTSQ